MQGTKNSFYWTNESVSKDYHNKTGWATCILPCRLLVKVTGVILSTEQGFAFGTRAAPFHHLHLPRHPQFFFLLLSSTPRGLPEVYPTHGAPLMLVPSPPGSALPDSPLGMGPRGSKAKAGPEVKPQEGSPQERRVRCHGHCEGQISRERVGQDVRVKEEGAAQSRMRAAWRVPERQSSARSQPGGGHSWA